MDVVKSEIKILNHKTKIVYITFFYRCLHIQKTTMIATIPFSHFALIANYHNATYYRFWLVKVINYSQ